MKNYLSKLNFSGKLNLYKVEKKFVYIGIIIVFILLNYLISNLSFKVDFSNGKAYTLSGSTVKIIKNLDDIVNIKFFISSDLPIKLNPAKNDVEDLLKEYVRNSNGKINVIVADPKKDASYQQEAKDFSIPELQFSQLENDKYAVTSVYFGIGINYGDKKDAIPQATDLGGLEYNLTSSIYKLTNKNLPKLGIIGETADPSTQQDNISLLRKVLSQQFETTDLSLADGNSLKNYGALLAFDKGIEIGSSEEQVIENYLQKDKGKLILFSDGVNIPNDLSQVTPSQSGLSKLAERYGIKINKDLILSTSAEYVNFGDSMISFPVVYPFWLKTNNFNEKKSYFSNFNSLTYPWASSLTVSKKSGYKTEELVNSTDKSWHQESNFDLNPQSIVLPKSSEFKKYVLTAESTADNGSVLISIPSSRFVEDQYLSSSTGNIDLILNILSELASGGALSGIRQRAVSLYPVPDLPQAGKDLFKYGNILFLPILVGVFGALRLYGRRSVKK